MYLLEEDLKFPKDSFKSMKYQPYEMKPSFSMVRVYQWWNYWYGEVYISFSGGLDSTVLAYIVCQAYRKYKLTGKIPLVFADTGTEFPEIREFVKTYTKWLKEQFPELDIELVVIRPKHSFKWVCENKGFPITSKDTAGKIRKLRHGKLSEKYRNYLLNGDKRGKFGMLAKKWQYLTDTERMPADISEYCCEALKKEPFKRYVKETGRQPFIGITQDESFRRENQYNHTGCNVYDGHTIKSQPMGFWPKNEVIQYAVEQRIPICSVYGTPYQDKKGNWYFTGEQRTGCCVCGFGCHLEPVPNRLQRLRTSDNDKHRRMCEGCLQIKNHGMTYAMIVGLFLWITGMGYWPFIFGIICGVITDLIVKSGNYKSSKKNILSCGVFNLIIFGNFVPMFMNIEAYFSTRQSFGQEYITKMTDIFANSWLIPLLIAACVICGWIGGVFGKSLLKKHFEKAGIA